MADKTLYRLDDDILFRKCSLFDGDKVTFGDCTNFTTTERNWRTYYVCSQEGIHFHCANDPEIELEVESTRYGNVREYTLCPSLQKFLFDCPPNYLSELQTVLSTYTCSLPF